MTTSASASADFRSWDTAAPRAVNQRGNEGRRTDQRHGGAHLRQGVDVRARHPAEEDVAEDRDLAAAQRAEVLLHGEGVEQPLGGMLVGAVAGVDHGNVEDARQVEGGTRGGVPDDDHVRVERLDVLGGVPERLALGSGRVRPRRRKSRRRRDAWPPSSKARRVRVLGSRKRLTIVLPRRAGTCRPAECRVRLNTAAVAWICSISSKLSSSRLSRCRRVQGMAGNGRGLRPPPVRPRRAPPGRLVRGRGSAARRGGFAGRWRARLSAAVGAASRCGAVPEDSPGQAGSGAGDSGAGAERPRAPGSLPERRLGAAIHGLRPPRAGARKSLRIVALALHFLLAAPRPSAAARRGRRR